MRTGSHCVVVKGQPQAQRALRSRSALSPPLRSPSAHARCSLGGPRRRGESSAERASGPRRVPSGLAPNGQAPFPPALGPRPPAPPAGGSEAWRGAALLGLETRVRLGRREPELSRDQRARRGQAGATCGEPRPWRRGPARPGGPAEGRGAPGRGPAVRCSLWAPVPGQVCPGQGGRRPGAGETFGESSALGRARECPVEAWGLPGPTGSLERRGVLGADIAAGREAGIQGRYSLSDRRRPPGARC